MKSLAPQRNMVTKSSGESRVNRKSDRTQTSRLRLTAAVAFAACGAMGGASVWAAGGGTNGTGAKISGASVARGSASITSSAAGTVIKASNRAVINYSQFDIPAGASVKFVQPSSKSTVLNRITGGSPSSIDGTLTANGRVFFVNPSGVVFGPNAQVKAAGFVAAAANIADADFAKNVFAFQATGAVSNFGTITAGDVHLFGKQVTNGGTITADGGLVTLSTGSGLLVGERSGTTMVKVEPSAGTTGPGADSTGDVYSLALRQGSTIKAKTVVAQSAQGAGGVKVEGTIDVSSAKNKGGSAAVLGDQIALSGATINASGAKGGGTIRVGGDYQGKGQLPHAQTTSVDATSSLLADATVKGNGGTVVAWSDVSTTFNGTASAKGGAIGGNGGKIETSGAKLDVTGAQVFANAPKGSPGLWLLDPVNAYIGDPATLPGQFPDPTGVRGAFERIDQADADHSFIDVNAINASLNAGTPVTIAATDAAAGGAVTGPGQIIVGAPIVKSAGPETTLTLNGPNGVRIQGIVLQVDAGADLRGGPVKQPDGSFKNDDIVYIDSIANGSITSTSGKLNVHLISSDTPPITGVANDQLLARVEQQFPDIRARRIFLSPNLTGTDLETQINKDKQSIADGFNQATGAVQILGASIRTNGGNLVVDVPGDFNNRKLGSQRNQLNIAPELAQDQLTQFVQDQRKAVNPNDANALATFPLYNPNTGTMTKLTLPPTTGTSIDTGGGNFIVTVPRAVTIAVPVNTHGGLVNIATTGPYGSGGIQISSSPITIDHPITTDGGSVTLSSTFDILVSSVTTNGGNFTAATDTLFNSGLTFAPTATAPLAQPFGGLGKFVLTSFAKDINGTVPTELATIDTSSLTGGVGGNITLTGSQNKINGNLISKGGHIWVISDQAPIDVNKSKSLPDDTFDPFKLVRVGSQLVFQQAGKIDAGTGELVMAGGDMVFAGTGITAGDQRYFIFDKSRAVVLSPGDRQRLVTDADLNRFTLTDGTKAGFYTSQRDPATDQPKAGANPIDPRPVDAPTGTSGDLNAPKRLLDLDFATQESTPEKQIAEFFKFKSYNISDISIASKDFTIESTTGSIIFGGPVVGIGANNTAAGDKAPSRIPLRVKTAGDVGNDIIFQRSVGGPLALDVNAGRGEVVFAGGVGRIPQVEVSKAILNSDRLTFSPEQELRSLPVAVFSLNAKGKSVTFGSDSPISYSGLQLFDQGGRKLPSSGDLISQKQVDIAAGKIVLKGQSSQIATADKFVFGGPLKDETTGQPPLFASPKGAGDQENRAPIGRSQGSFLTQTGQNLTVQAQSAGNPFYNGAINGLPGDLIPSNQIIGITPLSFTVNPIVFPRSVAEVIAGANPPVERKVQRSTPASGSDLDKLKKLGVNARTADDEILLGLFAGRNEYDDYKDTAKRTDGSGTKIQQEAADGQIPIAAPRIPAYSASAALKEYDDLAKETQPRQAAIDAAWNAYKKSLGEVAPTGVGFRKYLESAQTPTPEQSLALDTLNRLKRVQDALSLNPIYRGRNDELMISDFLPKDAAPKDFFPAVRGEQLNSN